jgi:hypothetical protein
MWGGIRLCSAQNPLNPAALQAMPQLVRRR